MKDIMFRRKHSINDGIAIWHLKMTAWLIDNYGVPLTPPTPKPLNYQEPLHERHWTQSDDRLPLQWAQDEFALICDHMHMGSLNISLIPESQPLAMNKALSENRTFTAGWQQALQNRIKLDVNENPIVTYDPSQLTKPGYLSARVILDLSKIYIGSRPPPTAFDPFFEVPLTLLGAAHLGQGFTLASLPRDIVEDIIIGKKMSRRDYREFLQVVTFASVLNLACRRLAPEQMIGSFGKIMSDATRRLVWPTFQSVMTFEAEVSTLRKKCGGIAGTASPRQKVYVTKRSTRTLPA